MARLILFCVALALAVGCSGTSAPYAAPQTAANQNSTPRAAIPIISVGAIITPEVLHPNDTLRVDLNLEPWIAERGQTNSGSDSISMKAAPALQVRDMRLCFQFDAPCKPTGAWEPYRRQYSTTFPVDWLGARDLYMFAEFRDENGKKISTLHEMESAEHRPEFSLTLDSVLDSRTPIASQPAFVQTAVAATRTAYPVSGSLELQNGLCCAGGKVGTTIELPADFSATSSEGAVTEMRTFDQCATAQEMERAKWEPFVAQKIYSYKIATANWVGWTLAVQFRDDKGNLSPVYCDDISIEGMP